MENSFLKESEHQGKKPVSIERGDKGVIIIDGISFHSDFFRMYSRPMDGVLYAVHSDVDDVVRVTQVRNVDEAKKFFEETLTLPSPVGEGNEEGDDDGL